MKYKNGGTHEFCLEMADKLKNIVEVMLDHNLIVISICSFPNTYNTFITAI